MANNISLLQKEIETKIRQFKETTERVSSEFEKTLFGLSKRGYRIDKDQLKPFMERFWHTYPTKNPNEWEVAVPVFIPFNIGWFDRTEGGYNIFVINKYTRWLGEELPVFISKEISLPPAWNIIVDGDKISFEEGLQKDIEEKFGKHLTLVGKNEAKIRQGHEFDVVADIIESGHLPFKPRPVDKNDMRESDFMQIWDELEEKYEQLNILDGKRSYQGEAWKIFEKYGAVGVFWGMSFGKTVLGTYAFSRIKGDKALVVPTRTLEEQWKEFFKLNCPRLLDEVEIYTYQGMSQRAWKDFKDKEFSLMVFDECLTKKTNIILKDGGIETIENIRDKQIVKGGIVTNKFKRKTDKIVKIYSSFGELESTKTHPHIIINKERDRHKNQWYNLNSKNIKIKMAYDLNPKKDFLLVPETIPHTEKNKWNEDQLAFVSLIICDGHVEKGKNTIKVCVSKDGEKDWIREVFIRGITSFSSSPKFWEFVNKRGDYTIGCSSALIKKILLKKFKVPSGKKSDKIDISNEIFYAPINSIRKFIDIAFSCEGWVNYNSRANTRHLYFSCRSKTFVDKLKLLLKKFGIHSNYTIHKKGIYENQYQLQIGSIDFNKFNKLISLTHQTKKSKLIPNKTKFMNNIVTYKGEKYRSIRINKIKVLNKKAEVFDFKTSTHNFLANGILTHNCHFLPADSFSKLATVKSKYRVGLSATPYREDGRTNYIMALTGYPVGQDWRTIMNVLGKEYHTVNVHVVKDLESKYDLVSRIYNPERRTIIFVNLLDIGEKLSEAFGIPFISGKTKNRLQIIRENKSFVASRVLELGVSIKDLEHIIEVDFLFGSRREAVQRTGRLMHSEIMGKIHDIIFTKDEMEKYGKRLYGLYEKGFRYKLIPHLSGIKKIITREARARKSKTTKMDYNVLEELYSEGYFVKERTFTEIKKEVLSRGIKMPRSYLFRRLNSMVRVQKKLFKIKEKDGYKFVNR